MIRARRPGPALLAGPGTSDSAGPARAGMANRPLALVVPAAAIGLLVLVPWTLALALQPFWTGVWGQVETVQIAQLIIGAAGACILLAWPDRAGVSAVAHPVPAVAFALCGWSVLAAPFAEAPLLSLTGPPQSGEGALAYGWVGVLAALAIALRRDGRSLAPAMVSTLAAPVLAGAATLVLGIHGVWAPYWFPDYLAFPALFGGALLPLLAIPAPARLAAAGSVAGVLLLASQNRAAVVIAGAAAVGAAVTLRPDGTPRFRPVDRLGRSWGPAVIPVAVVVLTVLTWGLGRADLAGWSEPARRAGNPLSGLLMVLSGTMESRARLIELGLVALAERPAALVTGFGWGSLETLLADHLLLDDVVLQPGAVPDPSVDLTEPQQTSNWDAVTHNHFHTHHGFLEALLSGGMPALVAFTALFMIPAATAPPARRWAACLAMAAAAGLHVLWFQMPATLPALALLLALLADPAARLPAGLTRWLPVAARRVGGPALMAALALLLLAVAGLQLDRAVRARTALQAVEGDPAAVDWLLAADCTRLIPPYGRGGTHLAYTYRMFLTGSDSLLWPATDTEAPPAPPSDTALALLASFDCATRGWDQPDPQIRIGLAALTARDVLAWDPRLESSHPALQAVLADWPRQIAAVLDRLPGRSDLAVPYLNWELLHGRDAPIRALTDRMLARDPADPIGLWFSGIALAADPVRVEAGTARMRAALAAGLERLMPVAPETKQALGIAP